MPEYNDNDALEATDEQLTLLRDLGVNDADVEDLSFNEAEEWIAELRALRENAGEVGGRERPTR